MRTIGILLVAVLLSACSVFGGPGLGTIRQAIAQQVTLSQQQLSTQFYARPHQIPFSIRHVHVNETEIMTIKDRRGYHVTGTYDIRFTGRSRVTQTDNHFDLHVIQTGDDEEQWWLASPDSTDDAESWMFYPLS